MRNNQNIIQRFSHDLVPRTMICFSKKSFRHILVHKLLKCSSQERNWKIISRNLIGKLLYWYNSAECFLISEYVIRKVEKKKNTQLISYNFSHFNEYSFQFKLHTYRNQSLKIWNTIHVKVSELCKILT